ncbi:MAG: DegT/DnrJ/EryC1/StrS family aminotransferase [Bacteroidota bacterium]|nr:DegT/DnrJ/EryC1/StrS family aminotransferase [Bacteroidota bacterium]
MTHSSSSTPVQPASQDDKATVHMVDLGGLHARLRPELDQAMNEVLRESAFIRGKHVEAFECQLNDTLHLEGHVVGCGNGTDALLLALRALEIGPGDEVIVPDFSFISTAEVVAEVGATPVFVDIHPDTFQIDPASAERARTAQTKAVMVVHLFGQCADMDALVPWADTHGLHLIEDNAQSLGAVWHGDTLQGPAGMLGTIGTTSFFPSKNLGALGDGGAVLTRNEALAARVKRLANHGAERKYHHLEVGCNSRLDGLQAAFLSVKLRHWGDMIARRQAAADRYDALLAQREGIATPVRSASSTHLFHQYCVLLPEGTDRDALQHDLKQAGIPTAVYYPTPLSSQPAFAQGGRTVEGGTPAAHAVAAQILALPMHTELTADVQTRVVAELFRLLSST